MIKKHAFNNGLSPLSNYDNSLYDLTKEYSKKIPRDWVSKAKPLNETLNLPLVKKAQDMRKLRIIDCDEGTEVFVPRIEDIVYHSEISEEDESITLYLVPGSTMRQYSNARSLYEVKGYCESNKLPLPTKYTEWCYHRGAEKYLESGAVSLKKVQLSEEEDDYSLRLTVNDEEFIVLITNSRITPENALPAIINKIAVKHVFGLDIKPYITFTASSYFQEQLMKKEAELEILRKDVELINKGEIGLLSMKDLIKRWK